MEDEKSAEFVPVLLFLHHRHVGTEQRRKVPHAPLLKLFLSGRIKLIIDSENEIYTQEKYRTRS